MFAQDDAYAFLGPGARIFLLLVFDFLLKIAPFVAKR